LRHHGTGESRIEQSGFGKQDGQHERRGNEEVDTCGIPSDHVTATDQSDQAKLDQQAAHHHHEPQIEHRPSPRPQQRERKQRQQEEQRIPIRLRAIEHREPPLARRRLIRRRSKPRHKVGGNQERGGAQENGEIR
jgi:hypothetical protein